MIIKLFIEELDDSDLGNLDYSGTFHATYDGESPGVDVLVSDLEDAGANIDLANTAVTIIGEEHYYYFSDGSSGAFTTEYEVIDED